MNRVLYLGLNAPKHLNAIHYPIIKIAPKEIESNDIANAFSSLKECTHFVFTSQTSVALFFKAFEYYGYHLSNFQDKEFYSVGRATSASLFHHGVSNVKTSLEETAEGLTNILTSKVGLYFWPHSAKSRPIIRDFFESERLNYRECVLYDTIFFKPGPLPTEDQFDEILFTSPSTVDAFLFFFKAFPSKKKLSAIGKVTENYLSEILHNGL